MENATWLDWDDLDEVRLPPGRVYLGCETCEGMLPDIQRMAACLGAVVASGRQVSLVTPLVTDAGLDRITALLDAFASAARPLEVVCNDWGVLEAVRQYDYCTPVIGRLLSRQSTDPRWASISAGKEQKQFEKEVLHLDGTVAHLTYRPPSEALLRHLRRPAVMDRSVLDFLSTLGVNRFEVSNPLQGLELDVPDGWHVSLHLPRVIVAVQRCPDAGSASCGAACIRTARRVDDPAFPVPLYMSPCEVFYQNEDLTGIMTDRGIDRIVRQGTFVPS
jgi:hypothetical protein